MDTLELGVIVGVIVVVLYWVVVLPAREKRKRERERERLSKTSPGRGQPWDPNLGKGRRNR